MSKEMRRSDACDHAHRLPGGTPVLACRRVSARQSRNTSGDDGMRTELDGQQVAENWARRCASAGISSETGLLLRESNAVVRQALPGILDAGRRDGDAATELPAAAALAE